MNDGTKAETSFTDNDVGDDGESEQAIVLFYHYFATAAESPSSADNEAWWKDVKTSVETLHRHQKSVCEELDLTGRILIAEEGINGTVAGKPRSVERYIEAMKGYNHEQEFLDIVNKDGIHQTKRKRSSDDQRFFRNVDWKTSFVGGRMDDDRCGTKQKPLFPDLKISVVKEIVSTGGLVDVHDIPAETGKHLSPEEFHEILSSYAAAENQAESSNLQQQAADRPPIALIDVRNTFEHNIGHFVHPQTGEKAMDPEMTTFSSFDKFCQQHAEDLKDKQVLMYCTGA